MESENNHQLRILNWQLKFRGAPKSFDGMRKKEMPTESYVPDYIQKMRDEARAEAEANDPDAVRTITIEEAERIQQYMMGGQRSSSSSEPEKTSESLPKKETLSAEQIFQKIQL
jgi:hypothetical protein